MTEKLEYQILYDEFLNDYNSGRLSPDDFTSRVEGLGGQYRGDGTAAFNNQFARFNNVLPLIRTSTIPIEAIRALDATSALDDLHGAGALNARPQIVRLVEKAVG